jgi:hypothetical protein
MLQSLRQGHFSSLEMKINSSELLKPFSLDTFLKQLQSLNCSSHGFSVL